MSAAIYLKEAQIHFLRLIPFFEYTAPDDYYLNLNSLFLFPIPPLNPLVILNFLPLKNLLLMIIHFYNY